LPRNVENGAGDEFDFMMREMSKAYKQRVCSPVGATSTNLDEMFAAGLRAKTPDKSFSSAAHSRYRTVRR
jgi:hypothetical protein